MKPNTAGPRPEHRPRIPVMIPCTTPATDQANVLHWRINVFATKALQTCGEEGKRERTTEVPRGGKHFGRKST